MIKTAGAVCQESPILHTAASVRELTLAVDRNELACPALVGRLNSGALMKAEHRHELKTNDLAKSLLTFQDYVKVYGGRVALGIAIVILLVVLIMQRINSSHTAAERARDDLAYARSQIDRLSHVFVTMDGRPSVVPAEVENVPTLLQHARET